MTLRRALLLLPPLLVGVWLASRWSALPDRFATSFDFAGRPRDETGRAAFAALALGTSSFVALVFGGLGAWIARVPAAWINVPDKEWWLAPERRAATVARLATFLEVLGFALLVLLATLFVVIGETAIAGRAELPSAWLAAPALLVAVTVAMLAWLLAPFREHRRAARDRSLRAGG